MIPPQTLEVLLGCAAALFYVGAVVAIGFWALHAAMGRGAYCGISQRVGATGMVWLGFVLGQGILGTLWLALGLAGFFLPWLVWTVCTVGWILLSATAFAARGRVAGTIGTARYRFLTFLSARSWYFWALAGVTVVLLLRGTIALMPTAVDDALYWYLVTPRVVALTGRVELLPFLFPYYGLQPLQVEMHWAALFAISNEIAVNVWDYLCAGSFLAGIGILSWVLTRSRRCAVIAVVMMLSTSGFYQLMGSAKTDNAAAQYGLAAFLWLTLWPDLRHRSAVMAGVCAGWGIAARFTNLIIIPGLLVAGIAVVYRAWKTAPGTIKIARSWITNIILAGGVAGLAITPMLAKNWLLVGCPLAPVIGCQDSLWTGVNWIRRVSPVLTADSVSGPTLLSYPFVWSFGYRSDMLGNVSPLFIGLLPFVLLFHRSPLVRSSALAGWAGFIAIFTWWVTFNGLFPYTRWVLVPLGLFAVALSTGLVASEQEWRAGHPTHWLIKSAVFTLSLSVVFQSRSVVYAVRYISGIDNKHVRYASMRGYDSAAWLNRHMRGGERIALAGWRGYRYHVNPEHLLKSETAAELEHLRRECRCGNHSNWAPGLWHFYAQRGFAYVVVEKDRLHDAVAASPKEIDVRVAFVGRQDAILKISHGQPTRYPNSTHESANSQL
jgi:hypothetical protein